MPKLSSLFVLTSLVCSSLAAASTPSEGVPLQVRRGFFTETDVGAFFTVGGDNGYSNLQTYLQLGIGYQLTVADGAGLVPIGLHVGIGANAQNCWSGLTVSNACSTVDNFTLTMFTLTAGYLFRLVDRLYLGPKLMVGGTLLDPEPVPKTSFGVSAGVAASLEYATNMDHFSVGIDFSYRIVLGPNISAIAIYPRVQYTF